MAFGRKEQEQPKSPYTLQVLTTEFLIEGTAAGDARLRSYLLTESRNINLTALESITLTPVHFARPEPRTASAFAVVRNSVVMMIPRAPEGSFEYMEWRDLYPASHQGRFHVGPFIVEGTIWVMRNGEFIDQLPATDVKVSSVREGTGWQGIEAPLAFINLPYLYGWESAQRVE